MWNKYTTEYVKEYFNKKGCEFLDSEYQHVHFQHHFRCKCGNDKETISFSYFRIVEECSICRRTQIRYDTTSVSGIMSKEGFLLQSEYKNCKEPIKIRCPHGHVRWTTFNSWVNGSIKCMVCSNLGRGDRKRTPYEEVKKLFESRGCILLTPKEKYRGVRYKVHYICSCNNGHHMSPDTFMKGVDCRECGMEKLKKTNLEKYGHECVLSNKDVRQKMLNTLYEKGSAPTSLQQRFLHYILGGELNYPLSGMQLDIASLNEKIYIEYDGSGHSLDVTLGNKTQEEFERQQIRRRYALYRSGWREIRIISRKDYLPNKHKIKEMYDIAMKHFEGGYHWIEFDIDNKTISSTAFKRLQYNFGKLKRIRPDVKQDWL